MSERIWKLTLTEPDQQARVRRVPQSEMVPVLRELLSGEVPARADLDVVELPAPRRFTADESRIAA